MPSSANMRNIPIGNDGEEIPIYWNDGTSKDGARSAYIMIHGKLRDGDEYWTIMNDALSSAVKDDYPGVDENALVIAPQFFSTEYNKGQYGEHQLAFGDVNAWQAGDIATHPEGTSKSSIDALDAIVAEFANKDEYPNIANITIVGHGGGGQLITRYAAVGSLPEDVYVRFIVGDASTHAYFSEHRPVDKDDTDGKGCEYWNTWRYGFDNFTGTAAGKKDLWDYFEQYVNRDIVFLVANNDTKENGDQYCPALMQGGVARRDRNLAWWAYINTLARTREPVELFGVASFKNLPDWSWATSRSGTIVPRLVVIDGADHDADKVFGSDEGRAALFSSGDIPAGWRPDGYTDTETDCSYCSSTNETKD
ncbi:hypothetical protein CYLTODRAFT_344253 [Cylindrobasidium torrendii FP15055 ss-10]|uniref:Alpha/beta-hydrolase n=1 Tax=Cylindrobasidium torrendii FP15055 ss-10 TaxID=1314674 RepID=A0A0D7BS30_9AGAR|nr:hypothetical protein CYLTODRAFT_344253 [Cylindrobasidium torrendii FP15055 ss-10]